VKRCQFQILKTRSSGVHNGSVPFRSILFYPQLTGAP
jgi:hypothetical protein